MKKIDILIPVVNGLNTLYKLLNTFESLHISNDIKYQIVLFFSDPWMVEDFCFYEKSYKNVKVLLVEEDFKVEHFNEHIRKSKADVIYFCSDNSDISDTFFDELLTEYKR